MSRKSIGDIIKAPLMILALANGAAAGLSSIWNMIKGGGIPRCVVDIFLMVCVILLVVELRTALRGEPPPPPPPPPLPGQSRPDLFQREVDALTKEAERIRRETRERHR